MFLLLLLLLFRPFVAFVSVIRSVLLAKNNEPAAAAIAPLATNGDRESGGASVGPRETTRLGSRIEEPNGPPSLHIFLFFFLRSFVSFFLRLSGSFPFGPNQERNELEQVDVPISYLVALIFF